jgi:hypothetical protein
MDYGTVNLKVTHNQRKFRIKIYPRMVHVMKAINSRLQGNIPRTLKGVRGQVAGALRMIDALQGKDPSTLGGFRIEVTVKARTLREARAIVGATSFLDPDFWLEIGDGPHAVHPLQAKLVTKEGLIANALWVYQQAEHGGRFNGRSGDKPTKRQIQTLIDVLNAVGWNTGLRTATKSAAEDAWWNETITEVSSTFETLTLAHPTDVHTRELFNRARRCSPFAALPCKLAPDDRSHRYQGNGSRSVRCSNDHCKNTLSRTSLIKWISDLVDQGLFTLEDLDGMAGA